MPPERVYSMVCLACHEADGRGAIARKTMKDAEQIPDLTDPKWQASRTDAELEHSILEGKGKIMLARKDILTAAHTDVKEMVALMRGFRGGKQVITGAPTGQPPPAQPVLTAAGAQPSAPVSPAPAQPVTTTPGPSPSTSTSTAPSAVNVTPLPPRTTVASASPASASSGPSAASTRPPQSPAGPANSLPLALGTPTALSPERAESLRVASDFFRSNCFTCHGLDGTGNLIRPLMPAIPDFTSRQWQTTRSNSQLQTSIVEGKGTQMPAWTGKISPELARDLAGYVRTIGAPDLLAASSETSASTAMFETRLRELKVQWDEVEKELRELNLARAKP
jgi:mono/diheme cytochrome c family protein